MFLAICLPTLSGSAVTSARRRAPCANHCLKVSFDTGIEQLEYRSSGRRASAALTTRQFATADSFEWQVHISSFREPPSKTRVSSRISSIWLWEAAGAGPSDVSVMAEMLFRNFKISSSADSTAFRNARYCHSAVSLLNFNAALSISTPLVRSPH